MTEMDTTDLITDAQIVVLLSPSTPYDVRKDTLQKVLISSYEAGVESGKDILLGVLENVYPGIRALVEAHA